MAVVVVVVIAVPVALSLLMLYLYSKLSHHTATSTIAEDTTCVKGGDYYDGLEVTECVVCLSQVCGGEKYTKLPNCSHGFHAHCIQAWLQHHSTCPLCRSSVPNGPLRQEEEAEQDGVILLSSFLSKFFGNIFRWVADPLSSDVMSAMCENGTYLS